MPTLLKLFQKLKEEEDSQTNFVRSSLPWFWRQIRTLQQKEKLVTKVFGSQGCTNSQWNINKLNSAAREKGQTPWSCEIYHCDARMFQHSQLNKCNVQNEKNGVRRHTVIWIDLGTHLTKNNVLSWWKCSTSWV